MVKHLSKVLDLSEHFVKFSKVLDLKYDLTVPRLSSSDQIHPIITKFQPLECFFYKYVFDEYLNMFLEGSETFISAILASRMKIKVLNYDVDLENIHLKLPVPIFWSLFDFSKTIFLGNRTKIFLKLDDSSFLPGFERIGTSSDRSEIFIKKYWKTKKL